MRTSLVAIGLLLFVLIAVSIVRELLVGELLFAFLDLVALWCVGESIERLLSRSKKE